MKPSTLASRMFSCESLGSAWTIASIAFCICGDGETFSNIDGIAFSSSPPGNNDESNADAASVLAIHRGLQYLGLRTFSDSVYSHLAEVNLLCVGAQRISSVSKKIFSNLFLSKSLEIVRVAVNAASRLVQLENCCSVRFAYFMTIEPSEHIAIQTFGTQDNQNIDCD